MVMKRQELKIRSFHMKEVILGEHFNLTEDSLVIPNHFDFISSNLHKATIQVLQPGQHDIETNTVMDVLPISTKVLGELGTGLTHTLTGVSVIMTGAILNGEQLHEFGSSEGLLSDHLKLNKAGTPKDTDYIIHIDLLAKEDTVFNRAICLDFFKLVDDYLQEIREQLKMINGAKASETHVYVDKPNPGKPKVALVKQVAGQGAMYDMLLFPSEPSGFQQGISIIDMNNMPVLLTANEYRDGAIRSMV